MDSTPFGQGALNLGMTFPTSEPPPMLRESLKNDDQLLLHVSGRLSAVAMLLTMEQTGGAKMWASRRVRFEHGEAVARDLLPSAKELGVVVVQQGTHPNGRGPVIPLAFGSDGPMNPYLVGNYPRPNQC